ncbi:MAG TPA: YdbL family protein [Azospirillum sp.]|nr:YdbL family protein [Azospirillum sp.]
MKRLLGSLAVVLMLGAAAPAQAQDSLAAAKAAGQVGERPDGLAGAVPGAPVDVQALVQQVNAQRLARYREIARGNGVPVDAVQARAGERLISQTPAGQYVMTGAGRWVKK